MASPVLARSLAAGWFLYRRLRDYSFAIRGMDPLRADVPWRADWDAAVASVHARIARPERLREDAAGRVLWRTSFGEIWTPRGANAQFVALLESEVSADVYRLGEMDLTGMTVVDAGANVGMVARMALERGARKVICFEPAPPAADCLERNLEPWGPRADVRRKALWSEPGEMRLRISEGNPGSSTLLAGEGVPVPLSTLDYEMRDEQIDLLKMDIEGAEVDALIGGQRVITRDMPVAAIATEHTDDLIANSARVIEFMTRMGYSPQCTEVHPYSSPSAGYVLAPYTIRFEPSRDRCQRVAAAPR